MIIPDANLLLYAYNKDSPFHRAGAAWWSECLSGTETIGLIPAVLFAFVRIATSPRAFVRPMTIEQAAQRVRLWLECPNVQLLETQPSDVLESLEWLCAAGVGGNLTMDAQLAAIAFRTGAVIHTCDANFSRFSKIRSFNPLRP